ncbi:primase-like DNA-binding domain-containing protein [Staphylococcus sp. IPLA37011]|uniref:primase-like DNA-binding domain-containing protein n=1 Tax=Staphylococcus TaxID=1279 RepID=UPI002554AB41|nr:primase-like DNA-binding domain-containing protein [Staphylococcus equorum]MDK9872941.1 primase-like DNA-binding domain-containing protein [Staphylococcus equorum]
MERLIIALEEKMEQEQLSYRRLSKKIGVATDTLNMFIKGKQKRLHSDTLIRIAIYANFNLNELKDDYREAGKTRRRSNLAAYTQQELDVEIWEEIKGYDNLYRVSNLGRVMRLDGVNEPRLLGRGGGGNNIVTFIKNDNPVYDFKVTEFDNWVVESVPKVIVYSKYRVFCEHNGYRPLSERKFYKSFEAYLSKVWEVGRPRYYSVEKLQEKIGYFDPTLLSKGDQKMSYVNTKLKAV